MKVAVTRPEAGELVELLLANGLDVVHVPLIAIAEPVDGGAALRRALARLASFDWVVVTSANGAARVAAAVAAHPAVRLAAVGPATAAALADGAGRQVDLVASVPRAEGLLAQFPPRPARVLLAQADRARTVLADGLTAAGHQVEAVVAYRTVARRPGDDELAALAGVGTVVFASGSAVDAWAAVLTERPRAVAIGPVTAAAARRHGFTDVAVAPAPDPASVVEAVGTAVR